MSVLRGLRARGSSSSGRRLEEVELLLPQLLRFTRHTRAGETRSPQAASTPFVPALRVRSLHALRQSRPI